VREGPRSQLALFFTLLHSKEPQYLSAKKGFSYSQRDAVRVSNAPHIALEGAAGPPAQNGQCLNGEVERSSRQ